MMWETGSLVSPFLFVTVNVTLIFGIDRFVADWMQVLHEVTT